MAAGHTSTVHAAHAAMAAGRHFRGQRYKFLRRPLVASAQLFVDVQFPPTNDSLFLDQERSHNIVWKRPGELVPNPQLFVEGASPNDVTQGILGNCWFVSACSALTHNTELLKKVIPKAEQQEWSKENRYAGIFRFCFWRFGQWIEVVVDDLLPTRDGKLLFARSKTVNEFWSALLEKAFAKLYGCYENLVGGQLADALQDVSGGVPETISVPKFLGEDIRDSQGRLFHLLKTAFDQHALIVAAIAARNKEDIEKTLDCGLVKGHAYAVTAVRFIELDAVKNRSCLFFAAVERQMMIRLQNPWGEREWNGPWSDASEQWEQVTEAQKTELGITVDEDGEFWMPWEEFVKYFTDLSVCQLFNTSSFAKNLHETIFVSSWRTNGVKSGAPKDRAGGCLNFSATFCSNPQYIFDVTKTESEVMLSLTQREPSEGIKKREPYVTIGMHIMKVERNRQHRIHQAIDPVETSDYANARSVFLHLTNLTPARYLIMPTTFAPREENDFMLRVYLSEGRARELIRHAPEHGLANVLALKCRRVLAVSRLVVVSATLSNCKRDVKLYCSLSSEGTTMQTPALVLPTNNTPEWRTSFVMHRRKQCGSIRVEVWQERPVRDRLIGRGSIDAQVDNDTRTVNVDLFKASQPVGTVQLQISLYDDPMYL